MEDTSPVMVQRPAVPNFYRELMAEHEEILRNKWFLSEHAGYDVGFDVALIDWVTRHRERWVAAREERLRSGS